MPPPRPGDDAVARAEAPSLALRLADAALYAVVLTAVLAVAFTPLSLAISGGFAVVKFVLFVAGFVVLAAGSWKLRPPARWREEPSRLHREDTRGAGRLQSIVDRLPPFRDRRLRDADRISDGSKLVLAGLAMLLVSYLMEAVLGVPR